MASPSDAAALRHAPRCAAAAGTWFTAHCILMLATIVHRTPTLAPYNYLLWAMRWLAVLYLAAEIARAISLARIPG